MRWMVAKVMVAKSGEGEPGLAARLLRIDGWDQAYWPMDDNLLDGEDEKEIEEKSMGCDSVSQFPSE